MVEILKKRKISLVYFVWLNSVSSFVVIMNLLIRFKSHYFIEVNFISILIQSTFNLRDDLKTEAKLIQSVGQCSTDSLTRQTETSHLFKSYKKSH